MRAWARIYVLCLLIVASPSWAATFYVRTDGGTADQCDGQTDAPYPGSGTNQPCAWSHPFWALDTTGSWMIQGGDTLLIYPGSYMIGYGAPNTGWCEPEGAFACVLPPLRSGPGPLNASRILGAGWDSGCQDPPELWGTQRLDYVLSLAGTSNALIQCLELTDHSGCVEFHSNRSIRCERDTYPFGEWAVTGIVASDSSNVTLKDVNIHGFAGSGVHAGRLSDWTVEDVRIAGNGWVGWDGDLWDDLGDSNSGDLLFRRWTVEWNGCAETYPAEKPDHCWAQSAGGYGDGVGVGRSGGHWVIEDSTIRYNTSDGLDLLYVGVDHPGSLVEVRRTRAVGNAGNQLKIGGAATVVNSLVVGNCGFFYRKSFAQEMGDRFSGDQCRAGGGTVSLSLGRGEAAWVVNSTIVGQGWALVEAACNTEAFDDQPPCDGSESVALQNSVFMGYPYFLRDDGTLSHFVGDGDPSEFTKGHVDYNVIYDAQVLSSTGSNDIFEDPLFEMDDMENFDGHLRSASPAIDSGLPVGSLDGLVPPDDFCGAVRPSGAGVDRGAFEYGAVVSDAPAISVIPGGYDFGSVEVGDTSEPQAFTISNAGTEDLVIGTVVMTDTNASEFPLWSDNCSGETLGTHSTCMVQVAFSPISGGAKWADLSIHSNDPDEQTLDVPLMGNGGGIEGPDLTGSWLSLTQKCKTRRGGVRCKIKGKLEIQNLGSQRAESSSVGFYLSDDNAYDAADAFLKQVSVGKIKPGKSKKKKLRYRFPTGDTPAGGYIIAIMDADNEVVETREDNNHIPFGPLPAP